MKLDCVIILGPPGELHSLVTDDSPKFVLPFLNVPLINLTVNYLNPIASKIFIVCLEKYFKKVKHVIQNNKCTEYPHVSIELITTVSYEGMSYVLNTLSSRIKSPYFIMCKGDIYGSEPLTPILDSFLQSGDDIYVSIIENLTNEKKTMCVDSKRYLRTFNCDEVPFIRNARYKLTRKFDIKDFFIIKTRCIENPIEDTLYCFKNNIIPYLLEKNVKIRVRKNKILQIKSMEDYVSQLDFKNMIKADGGIYNMFETDTVISDSAFVEDSVIGARTVIGRNSVIKRSIIMENVIIGEGCIIEHCIIGQGSIICDGSELKHCKTTSSCCFKHAVKASHNVFTKD